MKILFLSNMYPSCKWPSFGTFVKINEEHLASYGFKISKVVINSKGGGKLKSLVRYFVFIFKSLFKIICYKYDAIYCHYLTHTTLPIIFLNKIFFMKIKYFVNIHGDDLLGQSRYHKFMHSFNESLLRNSLGIIVPSEYFKDAVNKLYSSIDMSKIHVSYSGGVDLSTFYQRHKLDEKNGFCIIGRIEEGKGWEDLLYAISLIDKTILKDVKFDFYGGGNQLPSFFDLVVKLNISDNINYIGQVPHHELPAIYSSYKFTIFPTHRESLGLVLLESLACSTPVIHSDIIPLNKISDKSCCIYFKVKDSLSLSNSIIQAISMSDSEYKGLCLSAVHRVSKYSADVSRIELNEFIFKKISTDYKSS